MKEDVMLTPGPTEVSTEVIAAMMKPAIAHYDPDFNLGTLVETLEMLQQIYRTENEVILVPGSGRVALETSITSVIEEGDKVLTITAGIFGRWMKEMVERVGGETVELAVEWGQPIDEETLKNKLEGEDFKALTMVHNESTTGSAYNLDKVSKHLRGKDVLFMVDTVSSLGGARIETDELGIDFNMSACHKCIGTPPGVAFTTISDRGWEAMEARDKPATSFSYDLLRWKTMWLPEERGGDLIFGWRRQPITIPTHSVYALHKACELILEEGYEARVQRHKRAAESFRKGVRALGLDLFPHEDVISNTMTSIDFPERISSSEVKDELAQRYNIKVGGGNEELRGKIIRFAHMNLTANYNYLSTALTALAACLQRRNFSCDLEKALRVTEETYYEG